jgi:hypothetical protein
MRILAAVAISLSLASVPAIAAAPHSVTNSVSELEHGGGLNRAGCHNDNVNGGYHCH